MRLYKDYEEFLRSARDPESTGFEHLPCPVCVEPLSFESFNLKGNLAFIRCTGCSQTFTVYVDRDSL